MSPPGTTRAQLLAGARLGNTDRAALAPEGTHVLPVPLVPSLLELPPVLCSGMIHPFLTRRSGAPHVCFSPARNLLNHPPCWIYFDLLNFLIRVSVSKRHSQAVQGSSATAAMGFGGCSRDCPALRCPGICGVFQVKRQVNQGCRTGCRGLAEQRRQQQPLVCVAPQWLSTLLIS